MSRRNRAIFEEEEIRIVHSRSIEVNQREVTHIKDQSKDDRQAVDRGLKTATTS